MTRIRFQTGMIVSGLAAVVLFSGCSRKLVPEAPGAKHKDSDVVIRVDGKEMNWKDVELRARNYLKDEVDSHSLFIPPGREDEALQFFRRKAVMLFANKTVLLDEAKRRGIKVSEADRQASVKQFESLLKDRGFASMDDLFKKSPIGEKATRQEFEDGLYVDKLIDAEIRSKLTVTDGDRDRLTNEIITTRKAAKAKIDDLRAKLLKGADFATLARANSDDINNKNVGGDLGEFPRGRLEKPFEDAAFSQKVNEIGPIVETRYGYHIIKVAAHTPAKAATATTPATPESVHASHILAKAPTVSVRDMDVLIKRQKYDSGLKDLLVGLRAKAKIETIYSDGPNKLIF